MPGLMPWPAVWSESNDSRPGKRQPGLKPGPLPLPSLRDGAHFCLLILLLMFWSLSSTPSSSHLNSSKTQNRRITTWLEATIGRVDQDLLLTNGHTEAQRHNSGLESGSWWVAEPSSLCSLSFEGPQVLFLPWCLPSLYSATIFPNASSMVELFHTI